MPELLVHCGIPFALSLLFSFFFEQLLKPSPRPVWHRPATAVMTHIAGWLLLYAPLLLLLRRPWFAAACLLVLLLFVILISNAKFYSLREPFIYQDVSYFVDALRYPRLYLPFLGGWSAVTILFAIAGVIVAGLRYEQPDPLSLIIITVSGCMALGTVLLLICYKHRLPLQLEPVEDLVAFGLLTCLWYYALAERHPWQRLDVQQLDFASTPSEVNLPNLVVIQSESFFDPRRLISGITPDLLGNFDLLKDEATLHGLLQVPAWGANTVRTEFAFLSGIANHQLGIHRFKPYRRVARQGCISTIASQLKKLGYRTVCLHPYSSGFYDRNKIFPLLGFDEFIDISRFSPDDYEGQYVGDMAVVRELSTELLKHDSDNSCPLFVFVITMENHGPLHLEQILQEDRQRFYTGEPPLESDNLTVYLRHLEQADQAFGVVRKQMISMKRKGWLCLYGDHLPIMPQLYKQLEEQEGMVDYLIWSNHNQKHRTVMSERKVEQLPEILLQLIGLQLSKAGTQVKE